MTANKPKILVYDIETAPIIAYVWGLWENNVGLNMIESDWHLMSWSAKWLGDPPSKTMYMDQRNAKKIEDDKQILKGIWSLLNQADIVVTQNGKAFDEKKLNARFIINGMKPPAQARHVDTLQLAKRRFGFTSNKLEYMSKKLCTKYRKLSHRRYPGFEMWKECMAGNTDAWNHMQRYNKYDVLALEELYLKLRPWDNTTFGAFYSDNICECGSQDIIKKAFRYTGSGKFQAYMCKDCGKRFQGKENLLHKERRKNMLRGI